MHGRRISRINPVVMNDHLLCYARGSGLIEVLISLLILSTSLLGMAALQGFSMRAANSTYFRTQAINQTYNLIDRMRANPAAVATSDYAQDPLSPASVHDCLQVTCTAANLADYDLALWESQNQTLLPGGGSYVSISGPEVTVRVTWLNTTGNESEVDEKSFELRARL